jgi:hypothetical protein
MTVKIAWGVIGIVVAACLIPPLRRFLRDFREFLYEEDMREYLDGYRPYAPVLKHRQEQETKQNGRE